jgi:hypothetical protein
MTPSRARALCVASRKRMGIAALSGVEPVSRLARWHGTSRKFVRAQRERAREAVDVAFAEPPTAPLAETFPRVSEAWVRRFALAVILIVHGSYRQVIELLRDLFGLSLSVGTIHTWVVQAAQRAATINRAQDLSGVRVGLHDEIFQGNQPVLAGIDAASTYCYLLQGVEQRDADTWGVAPAGRRQARARPRLHGGRRGHRAACRPGRRLGQQALPRRRVPRSPAVRGGGQRAGTPGQGLRVST